MIINFKNGIQNNFHIRRLIGQINTRSKNRACYDLNRLVQKYKEILLDGFVQYSHFIFPQPHIAGF